MEKTTKVSKFKKWAGDNEWAIFAGVLIAAGIIVFALLFCNRDSIWPMYSIEGTVMSVGYKGITVSYSGKYGEERTDKIEVDNPSEYQIGDTITIQTSGGYASAKIPSSGNGKH